MLRPAALTGVPGSTARQLRDVRDARPAPRRRVGSRAGSPRLGGALGVTSLLLWQGGVTVEPDISDTFWWIFWWFLAFFRGFSVVFGTFLWMFVVFFYWISIECLMAF